MIELKLLGDSSLQPADIADGQKTDDLRQLANDMIDVQLSMIADCTDADVFFTPIDEAADDPHAVSKEEVGMAWTLGHVIVHCCASSEESTFLAAELARGVENHGRSRYEPHWSTIKNDPAMPGGPRGKPQDAVGHFGRMAPSAQSRQSL